jgi:hypothetical protein
MSKTHCHFVRAKKAISSMTFMKAVASYGLQSLPAITFRISLSRILRIQISNNENYCRISELHFELSAFLRRNRRDLFTYEQGWAKLVLIALERYSVALKRLTFNLR